MEIIERSSKVELSKDDTNQLSIKIHRDPIRKELKDKLSNSDIELALKSSEDSVRIWTLFKQILTGEKCNGCKETCNKINTTMHSRCMPYGNISSKVMFINAMPTELEHRVGTSHIDTTGVFLNLILNKMGFNKESLYFTDFMKCNCSNSDETSIWTCVFGYLLNEILYLKPEVIVCEGIGILKKLKESAMFEGIPDQIEYGKVYSVKYVSLEKEIKIIPIYELNKVLLKTGDDYKKCKDALWTQLNQIKTLLNN